MELTDRSAVKELINRHGFSFSKSLGQNFIINPSVCPRIAEEGGCKKGVSALEIGAGIGVLTKELAKRCDKVLCVEIDKKLKPLLDESLEGYENIEFVFEDVLKTDLKRLISEKLSGEIVVCANLPYYITSPVIMKILEERLPVKTVTVMVQKEAAERLCAIDGSRECGAVSYSVRYYSSPEILFKVSKSSFIPQPNVDSAVIRLHVKNNLPVSDPEIERSLFKIIRASFSQRRKKILNPLSSAGFLKSDIIKTFSDCGINPDLRPEQLTLDDFIKLNYELYNIKKQKIGEP